MFDEPLRLEIPRQAAGKRFDHVLDELIDGRTRSQLQKLVRKGRVKVDGEKVLRSNFKVRGGERVLVHFDREDASTGLVLEVLFADDHLIAVDKPPGMLMHPTERLTGGTVSELAVERFGPLPSVADANRPGVVHRLDRETSGVLVLARTPAALDRLRAQFRARSVEKRYRALVHGAPREDEWEVDHALGPAPGERDRQRVDPAGRAAFTRFRVLERYRDFTLVRCEPRTGRRHQIRVHLASSGLPIVGDKLYRADEPLDAPHQLLHAERLALDHPVGGARVVWESAPPASFAEVVERVRGAR